MNWTPLAALLLASLASCHPISTFTVHVTAPNGSLPAPEFVAGERNRISFVIRDKWNNNAIVGSTRLVSMHERFIHVIVVSEDLETLFHVHAEDYGSLASMSAAGAYFVDLVLPKSGLWSFAAYFVYRNGNDLREGSGSDYVSVRTGGVPPNNPPLLDFANITKKFAQYPLSGQVFNDAVDIRTNSNPLGYTVSMSFVNNATADNITAGCQAVAFKVLDKNGNPARNLVPYLGAAAHIIFAAQYDTLYHGHAMYLASYLNFNEDVIGMMRQMNMSMEEMKKQPMSSMLRTMMGAMMIGVLQDGAIDCVQDMARVMDAMGMDFNAFYGPAGTFGSDLYTLFDFPQQGNFRVFVSFAVLEGNVTSLVVADFAVKVPNEPSFTYTIPLPPTKTATVASTARLSSAAQETQPSASSVSAVSVLVLLVAALAVV